MSVTWLQNGVCCQCVVQVCCLCYCSLFCISCCSQITRFLTYHPDLHSCCTPALHLTLQTLFCPWDLSSPRAAYPFSSWTPGLALPSLLRNYSLILGKYLCTLRNTFRLLEVCFRAYSWTLYSCLCLAGGKTEKVWNSNGWESGQTECLKDVSVSWGYCIQKGLWMKGLPSL
jgi:hypothetical protein